MNTETEREREREIEREREREREREIMFLPNLPRLEGELRLFFPLQKFKLERSQQNLTVCPQN
jgi:hypothetical protein